MEAFAADVRAAPIVDRAIADSARSPRSRLQRRARRWRYPTRPSRSCSALRWGDRRDRRSRAGHPLDQAGARTFGAVAVLLETPEPLWRFRDIPEELEDEDGVKRFAAEPEGVARGGRLPSRGRVRHSTDGGRTLALLDPQIAVVGGNVSLSLRRIHHPMFEGAVGSPPPQDLLGATLAPRATWEGAP